MSFAENTSVPVERSRAEIERLLSKYGAHKFASGWDRKQASVMFEAHSRRVRFHLPLPEGKVGAKDPRGWGGWTPAQRQAWLDKTVESEVRRRWRALALVIKAKLEAVQSGITTFEDEFLAHIVLPGGSTVSEELLPKIAAAYDSGKMPRHLLTSGGGV